MQIIKAKRKYSAGQTLIETLAAVFILAMGITASVGLAIYALDSSNGIVEQIIATGLAREGLEAVRNMRDTNWLQDTLAVNGCYNFATSQANAANCYMNWLNKTFCLDPSNITTNSCNGSAATTASSLTYYLGFDTSTQFGWIFKKDPANFGLNFNNPAISNTWETNGFYSPGSGVTCLSSNSGYCRKIVITELTSPAAFSQNTGPLLEVQSQVWWSAKNCPKAADFSSASVSCRLELDTYLTNWKDF